MNEMIENQPEPEFINSEIINQYGFLYCGCTRLDCIIGRADFDHFEIVNKEGVTINHNAALTVIALNISWGHKCYAVFRKEQ